MRFIRASLISALSFFAVAGMATAATIQFSDYAGQESGSTADISGGGVDMHITANPAGSLLSIGASGLGVDCVGDYLTCIFDDSDEIDALLNESIRIDFTSGIVAVNAISFENIGSMWILTDSGEVEAAGITVAFEGQSWAVNGYEETVDLGGIETDYLEISATGIGLSVLASDFSVASITVNESAGGAAGGATGTAPNSGVPEPSAAMLFVLGGLFIRHSVVRRGANRLS